MGKCMYTIQFPQLQKIKDFMCCNGEDTNLAVSIENIACKAYEGLKLTSQAFATSSAVLEVGRKAPSIPVRIDDDDDDDDDDIIKPVDLCKLRKAIVVVSKEQLELLLRNSKMFGSKGIAVRFSDSFKFDEQSPDGAPPCPPFRRLTSTSFVLSLEKVFC